MKAILLVWRLITSRYALILMSAFSCVAQSTNCTSPPNGLISWWLAEDNGADLMGLNNGTLANGASFAPGLVGTAFAFNGANQFVQVPDSPSLNPTNGLSIEAWVNVSRYSANDGVTVVGKDNPYGNRQYLLALKHDPGAWHFYALVHVPAGIIYFGGATAIGTNTWYHVAMTYDNSTLSLYVNGQLDGSMPVAGPITVSSQALVIGGVPSGPWNFLGYLDELSLYDRALSLEEIAGIYGAGSAGKCPAAGPPVIVFHPQSQVGYWGGSVSFVVHANGAPPLSYLWYKDGFPITWATNSSLVLTNLGLDAGGSYSVLVTNALGTATSSNALLTVNPAGVSLGLYPGLTVEGTPGNHYGIQYATNVGPYATWNTLTQFTLMQPIQLWIDTANNTTDGNNPRRFYRVVAIP